MRFESVSVTQLRCLENLEFRPAAGLTLVIGNNGSGKTTLIEACALAAQGKSFLTNRFSDLVRRGQPAFAVRARALDGDGLTRRVLVAREGGETRIELDGQAVRAASQLARAFPMLVINSQAPELLTGGPSQRRALVDRTMFHVEQGYIETWKAYRQALRQRNGLLRGQGRAAEARFWNAEMARHAGYIDRARRRVVTAINDALTGSALLAPLGRLKFDYRPGWPAGTALEEQLAESWERDRALGFTVPGPHRADLALKSGGHVVSQRLSRGQCKAVVCTVVAATAAFMTEAGGQKPVLLVDDLAAELDDQTRAGIVDMISALAGQQLYTAVKTAVMPEVAERCSTVFHVEHHRPTEAV